MTNFQREVLIGCCLGDISIQFISESKARFQICQSSKHVEYVEHKYEILKDLCATPPKEKDEKYPVTYFNSLGSEELSKLLSMFKGNGIRGVPLNIKELLTDVSLAYWFCDDGTCSYVTVTQRLKVRNSVIELCTDRYSRDEIELLIDALKGFGINSKIKSSPSMMGRMRIYIGTNSTQDFLNIIEPYIPKVMQYKIKRPYTL